MKKLLTSMFLGLALVFAPATFAQSASPSPTPMPTNKPSDLVHAYRPVVWQNTTQVTNAPVGSTYGQTVRARINNWTTSSQDKLVCVEAMQGSVKNHVGCLRVNLSAMNTHPDGMDWTREFDAPLTHLRSGSYNVVYNSQDASGNWHRLTDVSGMQVNTAVTK